MSQEDKPLHPAEQLEGRYANYFQVGHNAFEILLDFGQFYPENVAARFHTRIITGPAYAKVLSKTLRGCIDQYEQTFGVIPEDSEPSDKGG
jgi:hypothetical protein